MTTTSTSQTMSVFCKNDKPKNPFCIKQIEL